MHGPGEYVPDVTEGVARPEDLPPPRVVPRSRDYAARCCPRCHRRAGRYARDTRLLHDLGDPRSGHPIDLLLTFSRHRCRRCGRCFAADLSDLAAPKSPYTHRVVRLAVRLVVEDALPYRAASWHLWRDRRVFVPYATIQNWVEAAGEKIPGGPAHRLPRRRLG